VMKMMSEGVRFGRWRRLEAMEVVAWSVFFVVIVPFFFERFVFFATAYLDNHQPPEARTTTDLFRPHQYFRVVCSDLAYGGDKLVYVYFSAVR
jgi:hypothetical protein